MLQNSDLKTVLIEIINCRCKDCRIKEYCDSHDDWEIDPCMVLKEIFNALGVISENKG